MFPSITNVAGAREDDIQDPRWELVLRISSSSAFARSEQLLKLFSYVCRMAILERFEAINEQSIGVAVFGRSPDYDSGADSIVRSHATRLRQKLERYFRSEGQHEPLRIDIPRGGYVPRFYTAAGLATSQILTTITVDADVDTPAIESVEVPPLTEACDGTIPMLYEESNPRSSVRGRRFQRISIVLVTVLATLIGGVLLFLVAQNMRRDAMLAADRTQGSQTPIERRFWETLFPANAKNRPLVVLGDSGLSIYETITGREVSLEDYVDGEYLNPDALKGVHSSASTNVTLDLAERRYTSVVNTEIVEHLSHLPQWTPSNASTVFARDLRAADAAISTLILLGSRQENPWISLAEPSLNFVLIPDGQRGFQYLNRHPRIGELSIYGFKDNHGDFGAAQVYGDIAYLPNPGGQGMIFILSGMWISGTQSAGRFVLDSSRFSAWLKSITNADGIIPPFEILLATNSLQGNATYTSIIAKRVYGKSS